jgi:hypothetical protein
MAKSWARMTVAEKVELLREEITACKNDVHQLEVFLHEVKSRVDQLALSLHSFRRWLRFLWQLRF